MKSLDTKIFELDQEFLKKEYDLRQRINIKRHWKKWEKHINKRRAEKEFDRKQQTLLRKKSVKLYKLKIIHEAQEKWLEPPKIPKKKPRMTNYANACMLAQLLAKLVGTDENGRARCICCPANKIFQRDKLDWWHRIPKWKSKATSIHPYNIHPQSKYCNWPFWWWWNYDRQIDNINKLHWSWTTLMLLDIKQKKYKIYPTQYIIKTIPVIEKELAKKIFDIKKYYTLLNTLKKRYL